MMVETAEPRTKAEAILDIRYQIRVHWLHTRFYRKLRWGVTAFSLLAGSGAIAGIIATSPRLIVLSGLVVAICSVVDLTCGWSERAALNGVLRRQMADLLSRSGEMSLKELDAALARHAGDCDDQIDALAFIAFNDNVRSNGYESWARPLTFTQRLVKMLA